jgi:transcriptional regulator with XRE-family HTH domain
MQAMISNEYAKRVIAANLKRLRGGLSYSEVARRASSEEWKCWPGHIEQIEHERSVPSVALLARIAEALGASLDDFLPVRPKNLNRAS